MSEERASDQELEGSLSEDEVSAPVADEIHDAKEAHAEQAADPGATEGQGVEPGVMGYAEPDTGVGESAESGIPEGVDALTDEQIQAAEERGGGGGDEGGGDDALDVSAIMQEEGATADETGDDAPAMTDPESQAAANTDEDA